MDYTVKLVPKQKLVIVNKAKCDVSNLYCKFNLQTLNGAAQQLKTKAGFKLYIYIAKNIDKYTFALSGKDFQEWAGVGKTAYDTAVDELITCGYLVKRQGTKQTYDFYENGREKIVATNPKVKLKVDINGLDVSGFQF